MANSSDKSRATLEELALREYLKPEQCERIFPHSASWWRRAFDEQLVDGYRAGGNEHRYLLAGKRDPKTGEWEKGSCRALLRQIGKQQRADEGAIARKRLGGGRRSASAALEKVEEASARARERVRRELAAG